MTKDKPTRADLSSSTHGDFLSEDLPDAPSHFELTSKFEFQSSAFQPSESEPEQASTRRAMPEQIAGYKIIELVGSGGVGSVYRAQSPDGKMVAIKILKPEVTATSSAVKRFSKEARVQAQIVSPYATRLYDFGCEDGRNFIVSEFVKGVSVRQIAALLCASDKRHALRIIRDVLSALSHIHACGVIHRDVKPENILVTFKDGQTDPAMVELDDLNSVKLTDFGLAREIEQSDSLAMTQQKTILGTPVYLSPEQYAESRNVDARADLYSVGATLYHLLAGRPPFDAETFVELAELHRVETPQRLNSIRPELGDAISEVVEKALEKNPAMRYASAAEMRDDIESILAGQPISVRSMEAIPASQLRDVRKYEFSIELQSPRQSLWPLVSDTDRFNRAMGLPAPSYQYENVDAAGLNRQIIATAKFNGLTVRWIEHAFQWIEGRKMSVLREFSSGPFEWVTSTVELFPLRDQRTRLIHRFQVKPRGLLGKLMTPIQFGLVTPMQLKKIYQRIDSLAAEIENPLICDRSFAKPWRPSRSQRQAIDAKIQAIEHSGRSGEMVRKLGQYLLSAADPNVARIRPRSLAESLGCEPMEFLRVCLVAAQQGLLCMMWDLICPVCRTAAEIKTSIRAIDTHAKCQACQSSFKIDFRRTVELIFAVHPEIRQTDTQMYCIGGPFHSPHVVSQIRLDPAEREQIVAAFDPGLYQLRGPQLPDVQQFRSDAEFTATKLTFRLPTIVSVPKLKSGERCVEIENNCPDSLLVRVERMADRKNAITAADVSHIPLFQDLFPEEVVTPDQLVNVTHGYVLIVRLLNLDAIADAAGDLSVRTFRNRLLGQFEQSEIEVAFDGATDQLRLLSQRLPELLLAIPKFSNWLASQEHPWRDIGYCMALNGGELMIGGRDGEYFGKMVREARKLVQSAEPWKLQIPAELVQHQHWMDFIAEHELKRHPPGPTNSDDTVASFDLASSIK